MIRYRIPSALPLLALSLAVACGCHHSTVRRSTAGPGPAVVLMTDFGLKNDAVGLMRGVIHSIAPRSPILDLTHDAPRFDIEAGALLITDAPSFYPAGTVFVVVVDPGVGTQRRVMVARLPGGSLLVAPDNGILTRVLDRHPQAEVRLLGNDELVLEERSATFHGRDVFAPLGAWLAAGTPFEQVGPLVSDWVRLRSAVPERTDAGWLGQITLIDEPFGNVWTDLDAHCLAELDARPGDRLRVRIGAPATARELELPFASTFADVELGKPLLYMNSRGRIALALNQGDFARHYAAAPGTPVLLSKP